MECDRLLGPRDSRIVPPKYLQERDPYVKEGMVAQRVMCMDCYNRMRYQSLHKTVSKTKVKTRLGDAERSLIGSFTTQW